MHSWGSRCYPHPFWGIGTGSNTPKNLPALKYHLRAKIHPDWIFIENIQTLIVLYIIEYLPVARIRSRSELSSRHRRKPFFRLSCEEIF